MPSQMPEQGWKDRTKKFLKGKAEGNYFKFQEEENEIRILCDPRAIVEKNFNTYPPLLIYKVHGPVGPNKRWVRCGKDENGEGECWLCDVRIPYLLKHPKDQLRKKGKELIARDQVLFQVAWIEDGKWKGPKPLFANIGRSKALGNRLMSVVCGPKPYDHPVKGRNFVIKRTGQGLATDYSDIAVNDEPTPVPTSILNKLKPLEDLAGKYDKQFMMAVYEGREQDFEASEDEEPVDDGSDDGAGVGVAVEDENAEETVSEEASGEEAAVEEEAASEEATDEVAEEVAEDATEEEPAGEPSEEREAAAEGEESYEEFQNEEEATPADEPSEEYVEGDAEEAPVEERPAPKRPSASKPVPTGKPNGKAVTKPAPAAKKPVPTGKVAAKPAAKPAGKASAAPPAKFIKPGAAARKRQ